MDSCFIQSNKLLIKYVNVAQQKNLFCQKWLVFRQFQIILIFFEF